MTRTLSRIGAYTTNGEPCGFFDERVETDR
jgi:hypothetical protein